MGTANCLYFSFKKNYEWMRLEHGKTWYKAGKKWKKKKTTKTISLEALHNIMLKVLLNFLIFYLFIFKHHSFWACLIVNSKNTHKKVKWMNYAFLFMMMTTTLFFLLWLVCWLFRNEGALLFVFYSWWKMVVIHSKLSEISLKKNYYFIIVFIFLQ